ncbi:hypothetical protein QBC34DRAFT_419485 [Podospora aff. communis PSN243]|uniref:Uncharacterized protein n=1 Tax=Podospora aff. communis PSN243 TaxID=3040156 RepID=A0AAV9FXF7_9PEZI|nr:hypothetical protein QBC34DRAFT_419485 [Podospora aff. communis PSN243]
MFRIRPHHFQPTGFWIPPIGHLTNHHFTRHFTMDSITSGDVSFGRTCPGTLMQDLQRDHASSVAKIKKLQTSFSQREVTYQCPLPCEDLGIVHDFITSIDALEELSVLHYEPDGSALWPAIYHHAASLRSLGIHTPPLDHSKVWTAETLAAVGERLPNLTHLEVDLPLREAEALVSTSPSESTPSKLSMTNELPKLQHLKSLLVNIPLTDKASSFAGKHKWNAMGSVSFPEPNKEVCERLARAIMDKFPADATLGKLEVRFARRWWDDRCQFYTVGYLVTVERGQKAEGKPAVWHGAHWEEYLVKWPAYGGEIWNLVQEYRQSGM